MTMIDPLIGEVNFDDVKDKINETIQILNNIEDRVSEIERKIMMIV